MELEVRKRLHSLYRWSPRKGPTPIIGLVLVLSVLDVDWRYEKRWNALVMDMEYSIIIIFMIILFPCTILVRFDVMVFVSKGTCFIGR